MLCDKATGAKKCLKRCGSQHYWCRLFCCEAGTVRNPLQMCRFMLPIECGSTLA
jgi:hypothetical protein